jgi:hypothetical protein
MTIPCILPARAETSEPKGSQVTPPDRGTQARTRHGFWRARSGPLPRAHQQPARPLRFCWAA